MSDIFRQTGEEGQSNEAHKKEVDKLKEEVSQLNKELLDRKDLRKQMQQKEVINELMKENQDLH